MTYGPIRVRPEAEADLDAAVAYYDRQLFGLGERFLEAVQAVYDRIKENPGQFPVALRRRHRAHVHRYPYAVEFVLEADGIYVTAVMHTSRDPRVWMRRI